MEHSEPLTKLQVTALDELQRKSVETHSNSIEEMHKAINRMGYSQ